MIDNMTKKRDRLIQRLGVVESTTARRAIERELERLNGCLAVLKRKPTWGASNVRL
jgi:hypothetical protein